MARFGMAATLAAGVFGGAIDRTHAQEFMPSKVEVPFDRYYDYKELESWYQRIAAAYPDLVEMREIGKSGQGRSLWVAIVTAPKNRGSADIPAMWIDGNVHGNEIQAGEAVLYSLHYLTRAYGKNERLTRLMDECAFYLLPSQNPDGRQNWFDSVNTSSSSRSNLRPVDDDDDGTADEDGPEDLDGDGSITQMWKQDPNGDFVRSPTDPRVFTRLKPGEKGPPENTWRWLGFEGIDSDGDGQINEDGPGGDDMNRNWPGDWQPNAVQYGAGEFPFSNPEPRAIGRFILEHPNIAGVQSYHNAGGMILRGPGASYRESVYPNDDRQVYDEIARIGEQLLPFYKSMVIYKDLYTVHGGFVNWTAESLGVYSFTNEMWSNAKWFQKDSTDSGSDEQSWLIRDRLQFGQYFTPYKEFDHPYYGKVLLGGLNKWSSRVTPTFMLEEECHRNFAFTVLHAEQMPLLKFGRTEVSLVSDRVWSVTLEVRNDHLMPTRSGIARANKIGEPDLLTVSPGEGATATPVRVVAGGTVRDWFTPQFSPVRDEPDRLQVETIPGRGGRIFRFLIEGPEGLKVAVKYTSDKATDIGRTIELRPTAR
ncbi:MAG: peptidase M14 [Phycisphaerae bacterium]|nr:peptidase M14 [Phycisphaerae bacterium]